MLRLAWCLPLLLVLTGPGADDGFVALFDGKTTDGWTTVAGPSGDWTVKDGCLVTRGQGGGWISTGKTYANFVLRLDFRLVPGGNSGVFIRAPREGNAAYAGMEIQLLDDDDKRYKDLKPFQYTGSVYGVVAARRGHTKPPGAWNTIEITADGPRVLVKLNGATITEANLAEHTDAAREHPGILRHDGYIGLQSHSDEVQFRNIAIKTLPAPG